MIGLDDRGFTLGDGVFETVLAEGGRLVCLDLHLARLARSAAIIGLPMPDVEHARAAAVRALEDSGLTRNRAAVRVNWSAGSGGRGLDRPPSPAPKLTAMAAAAPRVMGPATLHVASVRRNESSPASRAKTLSYLDNVMARREARAAGADEAVLLNTCGELACAAAANLFWIREDRLFTPALACGALDGTVRRQLLDCATALGVKTAEVAVDAVVLSTADAVLLTNSLIGVRHASMGGGLRTHPLIATLASTVEDVRLSCR